MGLIERATLPRLFSWAYREPAPILNRPAVFYGNFEISADAGQLRFTASLCACTRTLAEKLVSDLLA
jgi:hypothetical protein